MHRNDMGRMPIRIAAFAIGFAALFVSASASAHLGLLSPTPRSAGIDDGASAEGPCGGYPVTSSPTTFNAGETITIEAWVNPHTNTYRVALSPPGDGGFEDEVLGYFDALPDEQSHIAFDVTLPDHACAACTLQVVMWDAGWYACADVEIVESDAPPPPAAGGNDGGEAPCTDCGGAPPSCEDDCEVVPSSEEDGCRASSHPRTRCSAAALAWVAAWISWRRRAMSRGSARA